MKRILMMVLLGLGSPAFAAVDCSTLPNPLYLEVDDAELPYVTRLARVMRDNTVLPMTLVFVSSGSCAIIDAMTNGTRITFNPQYVPSISDDPTWTPSSAPLTCTIDPSGVAPGLAVISEPVATCTSTPLPSSISATPGPIVPYGFVAATSEGQSAITAEEAYFVLGFDDGGGVAPWTTRANRFVQPTPQASTLLVAANINVPGAMWKATPLATPTLITSSVVNDATGMAIGVLPAGVIDQSLPALSPLAFRAYGQHLAYWPNSRHDSKDRRNVRDGHYILWAPAVVMRPVDSTTGAPLDGRTSYLTLLMQGIAPTPAASFGVIDLFSSAGAVPDCAMTVTRSTLGGDLSPYGPPYQCGCKYDALTSASACASCSDAMPCAQGVCRFGLCEAR